MDSYPFAVVSAATAGYTSILTASQWLGLSDLRTSTNAISSLHSTWTTALGIFALTQDWKVDGPAYLESASKLGKAQFDDRTNPLIFGKYALGNMVTSIETGYLIFDTLALFMVTRSTMPSSGKRYTLEPVVRVFKKEPLMMFHHLSIGAALGCLQYYIARNKERGVWIIVAFTLMNASTPVLNLRWWKRQRTGKPDLRLDVLLVMSFAACRLGTIVWLLRSYGNYHGVGIWQAITGQRIICQAGTGALFGMNALWLLNLVRSVATRVLRGRPR